jgi:hypothetical protein
MKCITVILFVLLAAVLLTATPQAVTATDINSHHTPTPPAPTATPQPPTPVPPMPPLPVTPMPTPEPEPTPLAAYYLPLINWNVQGGGFLPLRVASSAQAGNLWIPYAARDALRNWFTFAELAEAEERVTPPLPFWGEYVDCELLPGSNPDVLIQLWYCTQPYEVDAEGNPIGSTTVYLWFEPATNRVEWVIMSAIRTVQP